MKYLLILSILFISGCSVSVEDNTHAEYVRGYQTGYEHGYESGATKYYFYACYLEKHGYDITKTHQKCDWGQEVFKKLLDQSVMVHKK